jgi:hypothetical protein
MHPYYRQTFGNHEDDFPVAESVKAGFVPANTSGN